MGLAGAAGVVATGVLIVRDERRRQAYTPDQVREQLHNRVAQAAQESSVPERKSLWKRLRERVRSHEGGAC